MTIGNTIVVDEQASPNIIWFLPNNAQISFVGEPGQIVYWEPMFLTNPASCARIDGIATTELVDPDLTMDVGL